MGREQNAVSSSRAPARWSGALSALLFALLLPGATLIAEDSGQADPRIYIVQLREPAAIDAPEIRARGERFDPHATAVRRYAAELGTRHDELLAAVGAGTDARVYKCEKRKKLDNPRIRDLQDLRDQNKNEENT